MLVRKRKVRVETERMSLRLPVHSDFRAWASLRQESAAFLQAWEPSWSDEHLSRPVSYTHLTLPTNREV